MSKVYDEFSYVDQRGRELTRLTADLVLYIDAPLRELRHQIESVLPRFHSLCPADSLRWYATESMSRFRPATPRSLSLANIWESPSRPDGFRELMLTGGDTPDTVPACGLTLSSAERGDDIFTLSANYLRFVVAAETLVARQMDFERFVVAASRAIPHTSGHAGYVVECNLYHQDEAESIAFELAQRHPAIDIATRTRGPWAVRNERIKNVAWFTMVGAPLLARIGGASALQRPAGDALSSLPTAHGLILRAGEQPTLCGQNDPRLAPYVEAYSLLRPLHEGIDELFAPFSLDDGRDEVAATRQWLHRFV